MFFFSLFILFGVVNSLCTEDSVYVTGADEALNVEGLLDGCYTSTNYLLPTGSTVFYTRDGLEKDGPLIYKTSHSPSNWVVGDFIYDSNTEVYVFDSGIISVYSDGGRGSTPENPADATDWDPSGSRWDYEEDYNMENVDILCGCGETPSPTVTPSTCTNGLAGVQDPDTDVCCPLVCGEICGGVGCGSIPFTNGASDCCSTTIIASGVSCGDGVEAPCIITEFPTMAPTPTVEPTVPTPSPIVEPTVEPTSGLCTEDSVYVTGADEALGKEGFLNGCYIKITDSTTYVRGGLPEGAPIIYRTNFISNENNWILFHPTGISIGSYYSDGDNGISPENPADATNWIEGIEDNVEIVEVLCGCPNHWTPSPTVETTPSPTVDLSYYDSRNKSDSKSSTQIIAITSSIALVSLVVLGVFCRKRKNARKVQDVDVQDIEAGISEVSDVKEPVTEPTEDISVDSFRGIGGIGVGQSVAESALYLAQNSNVPGVSEVATAISILVNLFADSKNKKATEASIRRCRSIIAMLNRASNILGKGSETTVEAERVLMEDVHDAIFDIVELVKTYKSKNKLSQLFMSTLFKKRQEEMGAVVDSSILGLQLGLHVQVGNDLCKVKDDVGAIKEVYDGSIMEARRARRQRKLENIEIPEDHVFITEDLLGRGGFGDVYLADYNGRNAAAKVIQIIVEDNTQYKSFLLELDAMNRLRSPYTVNVYGAITTIKDKLVLVMELLPGGDLRTFLKNSEITDFSEIIADICSGMSFLHSKKTIHGDLKSANVLLDGNGRAKIADFGTSKWTQDVTSTGLVTKNTNGNRTQMSLAWSAPEVLESERTTYASDVYSFGIVIWEILSREIPWASVSQRDVYTRVVIKGLRPIIPDNSPENLSNMAKLCWLPNPEERPTFDSLLESV